MQRLLCLLLFFCVFVAAAGSLEFSPLYFSWDAVQFFLDPASLILMAASVTILQVGAFGRQHVFDAFRACVVANAVHRQTSTRVLRFSAQASLWSGVLWTFVGLVSLLRVAGQESVTSSTFNTATGIVLLPLLYGIGMGLIFRMFAASMQIATADEPR